VPRSVLGGTTAIALLVLAAAYTYHFFFWDFDDAYIIFRIVRNLLSGHGWAFNMGEAHNASTSVLNTVALAMAAPIFAGNIPFAAHFLAGIWLSIAAVTFAWVLSQRFDAWVALGAGVALIVVLADNALWGLETHLFVALLGIFVLLEQRGRNAWAVLGLLTLTRPDALILVVLRWLRDVRWRPWPARISGWIERVHAAWLANRAGLLVFALVLAPWVIFSLVKFHQVFPDTLSNKMWQGRSGFWGTGWVYVNALLEHLGAASAWRAAGYLAALPGLVFMVRDRSVLLYVVVFAVIQQAAYSLLNVPGYHWYFAYLDVATAASAFYGVGSVFQIAVAQPRRALAAYLTVALYLGVVVFAGMRARALVGTQIPRDGREASYERVAAEMVANGIPAGPVATLEVGTFGYFMPEHTIIDLLGLTSANPEYVTGRNNDRFFATLPATVVLRAPTVLTFEKAIFEDLRFAMLYADPVSVTGIDRPMQYFTLKPGARPPTPEDVAAYVDRTYPRFQLEPTGPRVDVRPSADAQCTLDEVNGQLATGPLRVPRLLLNLRGWAYDRAEPGLPTDDVFVLLTAGDRRYVIRASRVARPDVAAAFKEPRFEMSGYTLEGSIVGVQPGEYRVSILQRRADGFVSCAIAPQVSITLSDALR
jgi:hypothetical protein